MYQGYFINLAQNEKRRKALTEHLAQLGATERYQRLEAVNGRAAMDQFPTKLDPGNLGLWLTHVALLDAVQGSDRHVHLIEDDTIFATTAVSYFDLMLEHADAELSDWDLIFTDIHVPAADIGLFRQLADAMKKYQESGSYALLDLEAIAFSGTSSFFINRRSLGKYDELVRDQWSQDLPIDLYLRSLAHKGELKAYLTVPFLTSVSRDTLESDIRGELDKSRAVATIYRRSFFQEADLTALETELRELLSDVEVSPLAAIYVRSLLFRVSDQWVPY
jgi:GR25 family glycosyltransferase involved in LPS biosynthesis